MTTWFSIKTESSNTNIKMFTVWWRKHGPFQPKHHGYINEPHELRGHPSEDIIKLVRKVAGQPKRGRIETRTGRSGRVGAGAAATRWRIPTGTSSTTVLAVDVQEANSIPSVLFQSNFLFQETEINRQLMKSFHWFRSTLKGIRNRKMASLSNKLHVRRNVFLFDIKKIII